MSMSGDCTCPHPEETRDVVEAAKALRDEREHGTMPTRARALRDLHNAVSPGFFTFGSWAISLHTKELVR